VLTWIEPAWEFDHPSVVLRPVVAFSPNGDAADVMIEELCLTAGLDRKLVSEPVEDGLVDRIYSLRQLKRRWAEARRGVEFPVKGFEATRVRVRFVADPDTPGELTWEEIEDAA